MQNVNYLVFLKNTQTGEEFTAPVSAKRNAHTEAMAIISKQYSEPKFTCLTAYSESEIKHALQAFDRWPGLGNATDRAVHQPANQKVAPLSFMQAAKQATNAKVERVQEPKVKPTPARQPQPEVAQQEKAPASAVAQPNTQKSVIDQLKALRAQS